MSRQHNLKEFTVQEAQNQQLGQAGYEYISTSNLIPASTSAGHWIAYTVLGSAAGNTKISITIDTGSHSPDNTLEYTLAPVARGTTVYGSFKMITITRATGTAAIIAYKG